VSRRELSKAERRAAIVRATAALVERDGLAAATIRQIADDAGVSPATVYNLIGSRDDVFDALFDDLVGELDLDPSAPVVDPLAGLLGVGDAAVLFVVDGVALFRPLMADRTVASAMRDGPRLEWGRRECTRLLRTAAEAGAVDDRSDLDHVGRLLVDGFVSNYVRWAIGELDDAAFGRRVRADSIVILGSVVTRKGRRILDQLTADAA